MNFGQLFSGILRNDDARFSAVSFFQGERLEVHFLKPAAGGVWEIEDKLWIPVSESFAENEAVAVRRQIAEKHGGDSRWIHLVTRQSAFIKTFSIPDLPEKELNNSLVRMVQEEIPHLADDILYHLVLQPSDAPEGREALLFGVSKATLDEQLSKLERFGVIPDAVVLSTEVLLDYSRHASSRKFEDALLVYESGRQLELLYVKDGRLIQSRGYKKDSYEQEGLEALVRSAANSFPRQGGAGPANAVLLGSANLKQGSPSQTIPFMTFDEADSGDKDAIFCNAALQAYDHSRVFDFTPPSWEARRRKRWLDFQISSLLSWSVIVSVMLFILSFSSLCRFAIENFIIQKRHAPIEASVKDLKLLQAKVETAQAYQYRKLSPVLLFEKLRLSIPDGLLLDKLEYAQSNSVFRLKGEAISEAFIHDFLGKLQRQSLLSGITLERVESQQRDGGRIFAFDMKGFFRKEAVQ